MAANHKRTSEVKMKTFPPLDMSTFSGDYTYWSKVTGRSVRLDEVVSRFFPGIRAMMRSHAIDKKDSFGFALATVDNDPESVWNNPSELIAFVAGWGDDQDRYCANAIRKIRPGARDGMDTQLIRLHYPELFVDKVESEEDDGTYTWGDFPWDGAVWADVPLLGQGWRLLGAVSALPKEQDPIVARTLVDAVGLAMWKADQPLLEPA